MNRRSLNRSAIKNKKKKKKEEEAWGAASGFEIYKVSFGKTAA